MKTPGWMPSNHKNECQTHYSKRIMQNIIKDEMHLIGIGLQHPTTNQDNQSSRDCGMLWQRFENEDILPMIPDKLSQDIYAVYYGYEGDETMPFLYFIGCLVNKGTKIPENLIGLHIPEQKYAVFTAKGEIPQCISNAWLHIWNSDIERSFKFDFEVFGSKSRDWKNAELEIYISID